MRDSDLRDAGFLQGKPVLGPAEHAVDLVDVQASLQELALHQVLTKLEERLLSEEKEEGEAEKEEEEEVEEERVNGRKKVRPKRTTKPSDLLSVSAFGDRHSQPQAEA